MRGCEDRRRQQGRREAARRVSAGGEPPIGTGRGKLTSVAEIPGYPTRKLLFGGPETLTKAAMLPSSGRWWRGGPIVVVAGAGRSCMSSSAGLAASARAWGAWCGVAGCRSLSRLQAHAEETIRMAAAPSRRVSDGESRRRRPGGTRGCGARLVVEPGRWSFRAVVSQQSWRLRDGMIKSTTAATSAPTRADGTGPLLLARTGSRLGSGWPARGSRSRGLAAPTAAPDRSEDAGFRRSSLSFARALGVMCCGGGTTRAGGRDTAMGAVPPPIGRWPTSRRPSWARARGGREPAGFAGAAAFRSRRRRRRRELRAARRS